MDNMFRDIGGHVNQVLCHETAVSFKDLPRLFPLGSKRQTGCHG